MKKSLSIIVIIFFAMTITSCGQTTMKSGAWIKGTVKEGGEATLFKFSVKNGTTYRVWLNDFDVIPTNVDVIIHANYENGPVIFSDVDTAWNRPQMFTADRNGTVLIIANAHIEDTGLFWLAFSTEEKRPFFAPENYTTVISLKSDAWVDDYFAMRKIDAWYSFNVKLGTTYRIWLNDSDVTSGNVDAMFDAIYRDGPEIFSEVDSSWDNPQTFTANRNGTVLIKVYPYSGSGFFFSATPNPTHDPPRGFYSISYSTNTSRPELGTSNTTITLPAGITNIENRAFANFRNLTSITIPNSVINIGEEAFQGCTNLTSITIPNSVTSIGRMAFCSTGITSFNIHNNVTNIGSGISCCSLNLTTINVDSGNSLFTSVDGILYNKMQSKLIFYPAGKAVGSIIIPTGIDSIEDDAFNGCSNLTGVIIPDGVMRIGVRAFRGCTKLTNIAIPESVTNIEQNAFAVTGLTRVTFRGTISANNFPNNAFPENLRARYLSGGPGTYARTVSRRIYNMAFDRYDYEYTWTRQ